MTLSDNLLFAIPCTLQGLIQSAFLWGYTATQLLGGHLADKFGGRAVIGFGVAWFSIASLLLPAALSPAVAAAGMTLPAVLLARMCVVSGVGAGQMCAVVYCRLTELS
jgi:ACS family sodium-dependent inorganic phosphate cotransporter/ACS family sodium-dependent inorganic phosphate cotransporter-like MFS transporter 9